jgi:hypothetical protein
MDNLQKLLDQQFQELPRLMLHEFIKKKLVAANVDPAPDLIGRIVDHAFNGNPQPFQWEDKNNVDATTTLSFPNDDIAESERIFSRFSASLPTIMESVSTTVAKSVLTTLKERWAEEYSLQLDDHAGFRKRLEKRWGSALGSLRMLLTISREIGRDTTQSKSFPRSHLRNVLTRLHVRACQVTAEIITLLENGYADGAMARWRTLHEITIVTVLMKDHGEPLAERYIAHQAVEAKSGKDQYAQCYAQLGYEPIDHETSEKIDSAYEQAIATYGKEFSAPYGWAAGYVSKGARQLGLGDLESAAGRSGLASHYKLASYNVHAGPHALFFRLGLMGEPKLLAGASNAGLTEPGQNTAVSLSLISVLLLNDNPNLDDIMTMKLLQMISRKIPHLFAIAERKLRADHLSHTHATKT